MITLVIATRNSHKVAEIRSILGGTFHLLSLSDFPDAPTFREDADSFEGNATKKAVGLAVWLTSFDPACWSRSFPDSSARGLIFVLADDSGLEVDALDGAPGVHSARFAATELGVGGNSPDAANNAKLLRQLEQVPRASRTARFKCVIALTEISRGAGQSDSAQAESDGLTRATRLFEGTCEGHIALWASGAGGFGYDPLFIPDGFNQSFAELGEDTKNQISHRARALSKLREALLMESSV